MEKQKEGKDARGRKPAEDKKEGVRIYIYKSAIKSLGGILAVQELFHQTIKRKLKAKK